MKRTVVRYQAKPEQAEENQRLIGAVFRELEARAPAGVRYLVLRLADGTFVHFAAVEPGAASVTTLDAFRTFQSGVPARSIAPPQAAEATIVGNYHMLAE